MTNEELLDKYIAELAGDYTDTDDRDAYRAELLRLMDLGAAVSASPHPRCPRCKESKLRFVEGSDLVGWLGKMLCESGKCCGEFSWFDIEDWTDFAQFFAAAPAQEPVCEYTFRDIGTGLRCDKKLGHDGDHHATMGSIKEGIHVDDPEPTAEDAQEQPVENSITDWEESHDEQRHTCQKAEPASTGEQPKESDEAFWKYLDENREAVRRWPGWMRGESNEAARPSGPSAPISELNAGPYQGLSNLPPEQMTAHSAVPQPSAEQWLEFGPNTPPREGEYQVSGAIDDNAPKSTDFLP